MVRNYIRKTKPRYSRKQLASTIKKIKDNELTLKKALKTTKISRATLYRYLNRRDFADYRKLPLDSEKRKEARRMAKYRERHPDRMSDSSSDSEITGSENSEDENDDVDDDDDEAPRKIRFVPLKVTKTVEKARSKLRKREIATDDTEEKDWKLVVKVERLPDSEIEAKRKRSRK
ncbi:uncharacterized protein LOC110852827 [Folsomia candida]|uniref:HTH psq-type domain-containing protein n=1 Tax=Folsomia candida TaxID=158441 RepID=A0A226F313_FOLCA|nr:uncharacterized protein LOC110852827 [Folsomia candida]XP_021956662.1 uncharacterized protein LOC110852827 [Folsomia candida]XP_035711436.1 uncharacterized protein LOC110852827 [Folsomia candida]OXA64172.1 hypothetical protein Fcan01_00618 [Folsomia candida]